MTRIHVLGGTGYAGTHLVREATQRGHQAVSYSRSLPDAPVEGVDYRTGDVLDDAFLASAFADADVVVSALSPRGPIGDEHTFRELVATAAEIAADTGVRFGMIGGAGSLLTEPGGSRYVDEPDFIEEARPESLILASVLDDLTANTDERLDWFFVSPAAEFGAHAPGTARGHYRLGGDVLLRDADGVSAISGADLALAIVDEIERPAHRQTRFTVAY
ncbi:NAD-dependent epimerase/dehydratase family protein [Kocuria soli]|uniref:NAD-dependent epimerase/dehydratase family protein n=1 Tax=Kocuria soli TaxID=2485125 RepID=A0A3N3ZYD8_9MICC|nr:NAD(P)H-binding protein [Kocuria soli]ROZ63779.1 NAD-dependent epimerase/dehydratase family protein [Kocuria soli]